MRVKAILFINGNNFCDSGKIFPEKSYLPNFHRVKDKEIWETIHLTSLV